MKIAMVVNSDPARDTRVQKEARSLVAAGHDVTIYGVRWPGTEGLDVDVGVRVVRPSMPAWIERGGVLNTLRKTAVWYERMRPLVTAAMASDPDVLHAHDLDTIGPASAAARERGVACVYDDHEASYVDKLPNYVPADATGMRRSVLDALTRRLQRRGEALEREVRRRGLAAVITVSDALGDRLVARFGGPQPVVLRNIASVREIPRTNALRERLGLPKSVRILVYHGTATEGSGIETVVNALRVLPPEYVFVLVGRVWRQERYEEIARTAGVTQRLHFVPTVPIEEMFRLVASADVAVIPSAPNSVGNEFGIPNKLFESLMAGLPIVASDVPEVAAIVRRTGAGVLYPCAAPQDSAALAGAVRSVCEDPEKWASMRASALDAARQEFNWERESVKLLALYERLASARKSQA